jgi:hypothetical protein
MHQQTGVLLWHHYDILNKLYPLWHYYDIIIALITFTKVWLLWHIMTKSRKTLLLHLWHFYYCHYDISNILWHLWLLWHYYLHYCILNYYNTYDIEVLLLAIMTIAKHYVHYGYYHNCHNSHNSHNSYNIFLLILTHKSGIRGWILGLTGGKHSYIQGPAIAAKILWKPNGQCTSFLADTLPKQASSTVFDPQQVSDADAMEPHIQPKVYICDALPEEPSRIGTAEAEQTIAWPKHGDASRAHGTFLHASALAVTP